MSWEKLIRSSEIDLVFGVLPANDTLAMAFFLAKGNAAGGGLGVFLDLRLAFCRFTPVGKCPAVLDNLYQFGIIFRVENMTVTESSGAFQEGFLDVSQQVSDE